MNVSCFDVYLIKVKLVVQFALIFGHVVHINSCTWLVECAGLWMG